MKKILILLILFLCSFSFVKIKLKNSFVEQVNLNIKENELGILFYEIEENRYMVIATQNQNILLLIDKENVNKNKEILNKLGIFEYQIKNLDTISTFNDIIIKQEKDLIKVRYNDMQLCVASGGEVPPECMYTYLLKESLFDDMKLAFYHDTFSSSYEELLYEKWVDSYKLSNDSITFVKFYEDTYSVINISKNIIDLR